MIVNQFHSGTAMGDAITNQMLDIQATLRAEGYESDIYADHIVPELASRIKPINLYKGTRGGVLLVHHSMGFDSFDKIISLPDKKCLIYHNITPEEFFDDKTIIKYIRKGLKQAKAYRYYVEYAIADSNFNRQELLKMGYRCVDVMPVQVSLERLDKVKKDNDVISEFSDTQNILFVGRLAPNKHQDDIIKAFAIYTRYFEINSRLLLVGDDVGMQNHVQQLKQLCAMYKIENKVKFLGKVSDSALKSYYEVSHAFLCMSEHEGFGVPLLEAMAMGIPVIAYRSSAVPETMGGSGILLKEKDAAVTAALLHEIISDKELNRKIVLHQLKRIEKLKRTNTKKILLKAIQNITTGMRPRTIQMQGPFETSYSLALVNRKLMEAMDDFTKNDVSIFCTEGPGDYVPDAANLIDKPHASLLWEKSADEPYPDIVLRNMYPPRVSDTVGGINFQAFGWEETMLPKEYVENFNQYLSGIGTMSEFVTNTLKSNGVTIPIETIGVGVDLPPGFENIEAYKPSVIKKTYFLHISSAFPRKGTDILLRAYFNAFTATDDVCLILKTFPNPHNNLIEDIKKLRNDHKSPPAVELINRDMETEELYSLYKIANCYVHVARGEGFGLPVAEAMLAKVPVIVSPNTGMADFCNNETAILIDYEMEKARTHLTEESSMWAVPNVASLTKKLQEFHFFPRNFPIQDLVNNAYNLISTEFTWEAMAKKWDIFLNKVEENQYSPKVSMVSTWNSKCGIAEYSRMFFENMGARAQFTIYPNDGVQLVKGDEEYVAKRLWRNAFEGDTNRLIDQLKSSASDIVHIQFNFGFFTLENLGKIIEELYNEKAIIITLHKTEDTSVAGKIASLKTIVKKLNKCSSIITHQVKDKELLVSYGVSRELISIIPLGQVRYRDTGIQVAQKALGVESSLVLGSYGFLLPNKGIKECIQAVAMLKQKYPNIRYFIRCALHDDNMSQVYYEECKSLVMELKLEKNIKFLTDFMPDSESIRILQACNILLMTYLPVTESASGAVRLCAAAERVLITTKQDIFEEYADCSKQIEQATPCLIAEAVNEVLQPDEYSKYIQRLKQKLGTTEWAVVCDQIYNLYKLVDQKTMMQILEIESAL